MSWHGKRVLVTGAGGFIGSHLTEQLVEAGATVRALTHYNGRGTAGWLEDSDRRADIEIVAGDICDPDVVHTAMEKVEIVFHLAALIAIPFSYQAPTSYVRVNIEGTLNVLQCARRLGVSRVVHTSTSEVYGTAQTVPIAETHPIHPQSPYAASKAAADQMAGAFHLSYGVPVAIVRPFNTFGPRQSARAVIPAIMSQCLASSSGGGSGGTVRLGNLTPTRDLNYVGNTVDGFLRAALADGAIGQTVNLGSGREISIGDLARLIARVAGRTIAIESDEERRRPEASEVGRLLADNTLAKTILGWEPAVSLEDGLGRTLAWMERNIARYGVAYQV